MAKRIYSEELIEPELPFTSSQLLRVALDEVIPKLSPG